ncbi:bacterial Ig-like domain-containing protein [Paenibacillus sp. 32O-W]|uniref:Ig-like domain-containing protein n=1 Tax=Paenibacillus sp. 32O-W TaxID=1695218 RepID=UPI00071F91F5|nr:Ig-like domain-containing protein [Paenibacillus sp. 32O-W]ALS29965.1 bacterial Ig-like domain-containing protein [Paenibacillus sp. 32O-W]
MTFRNGSTKLGEIVLTDGLATIEVDDLAAGPPAIEAAYSGDSSFASSDDTVSQDVGNNASLSVNALSVGSHMINLRYSGDQAFDAGLQSVGIIVNKADTDLDATSPQNTVVFGEAVTVTVHVAAASPGNGTPTGAVTLHLIRSQYLVIKHDEIPGGLHTLEMTGLQKSGTPPIPMFTVTLKLDKLTD